MNRLRARPGFTSAIIFCQSISRWSEEDCLRIHGLPELKSAGKFRRASSFESEHTALAVVDFGQKFLINHQGRIFKAWDPAEAQNLPVISGLNLSDLKVYGRLDPSYPGQAPVESAPFRAVMQVLSLGKQQGSILPNHLIRQISVDRQIGLTIYAFDRLKAISLGYSDYIGKYHMLAKLFSYLKGQRSFFDFDRIDLNNLQRIVVNPIKMES